MIVSSYITGAIAGSTRQPPKQARFAGKADETVTFSLGGTQYVIDLSEKNASALRNSLAKYIEAARKEKGTRLVGRGGQRKVATSAGPNTSEVRTWAKAQGYEVSERGRVSKDLIVKFEEAHG